VVDNSGRITKFDKAHYELLIKYLMGVDDTINREPYALGPSSDLKLDATLPSRLPPGATDWAVAKDLNTAGGTFAGSVHARYVAVEQEVRTFYKALKDAEDVFDDTDDLTTYDASKFGRQHPDIVGGGSA
jgi:hypothetical protein